MYDFNYHRPSNLDDAVKLMRENEDGVLMSGGMTLIPTMKQRLAMPSDIIDLTGLRNRGIARDGSIVVIGAGTCHADVAQSSVVRETIPALAELAGGIGDPHVRNRGTIGGSIANNDPAADYPAGLVGLDATVVTNERRIAAQDFFAGMFETALEHGEIVTGVEFKVPVRAAYAKFDNPASRYAIVGVFVADFGGDVRVAVTGAGPCVFRHSAMEKALVGSFSAATVANVETDGADFNEDIHASADYRTHLVGVMARRAVDAAVSG
jgi:carbon-monoxide dehydrogenase medium subunit